MSKIFWYVDVSVSLCGYVDVSVSVCGDIWLAVCLFVVVLRPSNI